MIHYRFSNIFLVQLFLVCSLLLAGWAGWAQEPKAENEIPVKLQAVGAVTSSADSESAQSKLFIGLASVVLIAAGILWALKKYSIHNGKSAQNKIKVLTQYHMGPKRSLAIVQVAGESILVGLTDHHISHIKTLSLLDEDLPELEQKSFGDVASDTVLSEQNDKDFKVDLREEFKITGLKQLGKGLR